MSSIKAYCITKSHEILLKSELTSRESNTKSSHTVISFNFSFYSKLLFTWDCSKGITVFNSSYMILAKKWVVLFIREIIGRRGALSMWIFGKP